MEQTQLFKEKKEKITLPKVVITQDFVLNCPNLREYVFEEDEQGRYRERIIEEIRKYGIEKWFIFKGYPIDKNSVWVNRYMKSETTLGDQCFKSQNPDWNGIEYQGYYLWENWMPKGEVKNYDQEIEIKGKELKELLIKKYGCDVTIKIFKGEK